MIRRVVARLVSGLLLSLAVCVGGATPSAVVQAASSSEPAAAQGPSAAGVRVDPRQVSAPEGDTPKQLPRRYPVAEATLGRLKAEANAAAAARDTSGGGAVRIAPTASFAGLSMGDAGGWNPPDGGLAVGPQTTPPIPSVLVAVNEGFAVYDRTGHKQAPMNASSTRMPA